MKIISLLFISFLILSGCSSQQRQLSQASPVIKILLTEGMEAQINPSRNYVIVVNSRKELGSGNIYLTINGGRIVINDLMVSSGQLEIYPEDYFLVSGKKYRGSIQIIADGNHLLVINVVDIESYLYGVLPDEVSSDWNVEALKAQAVVSRTFALFEVTSARKKNKVFDVYDDTRSQVYNGMDHETKFASTAVDSTFGEVVRYQGKIIQAFFHSASGGMTESSKEVFGFDYPYLVPVTSPFCNAYKENKWETSVPLVRIQKSLKLSAPIISVKVTERTASKRIKALEISDASGKKIPVTANNFRNLVGNTVMKSTRANIRLTNDTIWVYGMGYGHGVGMGQWDAQGMAQQGYRYRDIVSFFYPGTTLDRIW